MVENTRKQKLKIQSGEKEINIGIMIK